MAARFRGDRQRATISPRCLPACASAGGVDVLALRQQPLRWRDLANPMAQLPHQTSVNDCPVLAMPPGAAPADLISNSFRRRLKGKERKLQALPGYRYGLARTEADVDRLLDAFFRVKPLRMAAQKLPNVFADPGVEPTSSARACSTPNCVGGGHAIEIHALECDDEMIAMYAGVADGSRFSMMFNTYTLSETSRYSPGLILMRNIVDHYAARGYRWIDLGIGSDDYKKLFCKELRADLRQLRGAHRARPDRGRNDGCGRPGQARDQAQSGADATGAKAARRAAALSCVGSIPNRLILHMPTPGRARAFRIDCPDRPLTRRRSDGRVRSHRRAATACSASSRSENPTAFSCSAILARASAGIVGAGTTRRCACVVSSSAGRSEAVPASSSM